MTKKVMAVLALALGFAPVHAEHANISLRVMRLDPQTGLTKDEALASADQEPPQGGIVSRPLFKIKAHDPLVLQFIFVNTYPHGVNKNVTVRILSHRWLPPSKSCFRISKTARSFRANFT